MPVATANGKKFTFPAGTTPEEMGAAIDEYFQKQAPQQEPPAEAAPPSAPAVVPPIDYEQVARDTANDMSGYEQFAAGMGGAVAGLGIGGRQILANMLGNEDWQKQLQEEAMEYKRLTGALNDTGAGMAGNLAGNVAMAALPGGLAGRAAGGLAAAAPAALAPVAAVAAPIAVEGALGAGMGALEPTTEEGERANNMLVGGALGGAMPAAGSAYRALTGRVPLEKAAAAKALKEMGVDVPYRDTISGGLPETPGMLSKYMMGFRPESEQSKTLVNAQRKLFDMLGTEMPTTLQEMKGVSREVGERLGRHTVGIEIPSGNIPGEIDNILARYSDMAPTLQKKKVYKLGQDIIDMTDNGSITGREYSMNRKELARTAAKTGGEAGRKMQEMLEVLDEGADAALGPRAAQALAADREKYRMALAIKNAAVKNGEIKSEALLKPLSKIFGSKTNDEALAMLQQADKLKSTAGGKGLMGTLLRVPAQFSRPKSRATAAAIIRGANQTVNEED